jgi:hypothetical protein
MIMGPAGLYRKKPTAQRLVPFGLADILPVTGP